MVSNGKTKASRDIQHNNPSVPDPRGKSKVRIHKQFVNQNTGNLPVYNVCMTQVSRYTFQQPLQKKWVNSKKLLVPSVTI